LYERVQELVDRDRLAALVALAEIVALQHASDGMPCGKLDQTRSAHFVHPAGIELDARALRIEDLEDLLLIGRRIRLDFFRRQSRAGRVAAGRIADEPREVADQENDLVAEFL